MRHYSNECPMEKKDGEDKKVLDPDLENNAEAEQEGVLQVTTGGNKYEMPEISELDFGSGFMFTLVASKSVGKNEVINGKIDKRIVMAASKKRLPKYYILLDNQANLPVFYNEELLTRVWKVKITMRINSNGGVSETNWKGWCPGYGEVWLHRDGIANILPLCKVKK
eukprot:CAMPEP_0202469500 /NCGR_PEP_ID=MMETSP1360-20130828/78740_1 /ASSEMBLY_ACC=CAM_ASM_000848 /TAXON_ID=515479 /ORGANISM="Licmophora paradoxa, Strain CCMP2313" /LENGTH=166 /DNA_ID=CAMNT_0049094867 /DNA_START=54 /DNA_END=551 /DNA_ORIENTATION=-